MKVEMKIGDLLLVRFVELTPNIPQLLFVAEEDCVIESILVDGYPLLNSRPAAQ